MVTDITRYTKNNVYGHTAQNAKAPSRSHSSGQYNARIISPYLGRYQDLYESTNSKIAKRTETAKQRAIKKQALKRAWTNRILGALAAAGIIAGGAKAVDSLTTKQNFNAAGHTIQEVGEWTDVNPGVILMVNNLEPEDANSAVYDIILPDVYSPAGEEISQVKEKLENGNVKGEEIDQLQQKLTELTETKQTQDEIATVYTTKGDKYAYICPNRLTRVETIKTFFEIEDGIIKKYNKNLEYDWGVDTSVPVHRGYKDYTDTTVREGDILKVPLKSIGSASAE